MSNLSEKTKKQKDDILTSTRKKFGDEAIHLLGDSRGFDIEAVPTGSFSLDIALGIGGLPRGRIVEVYGPESSGKTTLCQHIIAEAQKLNGICIFVDTEHALDPVYAEKCGVNIKELFISQPDSGEQALEITDSLLDYKPTVIVVDSVAALVPRAEIEGQMGDSHMGLQARLMSQALRKLTGRAKKSNTTIIFTNQLRQKIGVVFGNPETTTGGMALRFYASVRLDIRRIESVKQEGEVIANKTKVTVRKNRVSAPLKVAEFDIVYNEGISKVGEIIDLCVDKEIIDKRGSFYNYGEVRLAQGKKNAELFLSANKELLTEIENELRTKLRLPLRMEE